MAADPVRTFGAEAQKREADAKCSSRSTGQIYPRWSRPCRWMRDRSSQRLDLSRRGAFARAIAQRSAQLAEAGLSLACGDLCHWIRGKDNRR
jgi:hypothetical protein